MHKNNLNDGVKWSLFFVMVILMVGYLVLACSPVKLRTQKVVIEAGEIFDPEKALSYQVYDCPITIQSDVNVDQPGTYTVVYTSRNVSQALAVQVLDTTPPKVIGKDVKCRMDKVLSPLDFIEAYQDVSAVTFYFAEPLDLHPGMNPVQIIAMDAYGNRTFILQQVTIVMIDLSAPTIEVVGRLEVEQGKPLDLGLSGLLVHDDCDQHLQLTSSLDTHPIYALGDYDIPATVTDRSGNQTTTRIPITIVPVQPNASSRYIYLTFDDGPSQNTPRVLDILDKYGIRATFFVTGMNPAYANWIGEASRQGHAIGLHTYGHEYATIYASLENYFADLKKISELVESQTGTQTNLLRFPGGSSNLVSRQYHPGLMSQLVNEVEARGYRYFDWNSSVDDAVAGHGPEEILATGKAQTELKGDLMLLLHDGSGNASTVSVLEELVVYFLEKGYVFKAIDASTTPVHHQIFN